MCNDSTNQNKHDALIESIYSNAIEESRDRRNLEWQTFIVINIIYGSAIGLVSKSALSTLGACMCMVIASLVTFIWAIRIYGMANMYDLHVATRDHYQNKIKEDIEKDDRYKMLKYSLKYKWFRYEKLVSKTKCNNAIRTLSEKAKFYYTENSLSDEELKQLKKYVKMWLISKVFEVRKSLLNQNKYYIKNSIQKYSIEEKIENGNTFYYVYDRNEGDWPLYGHRGIIANVIIYCLVFISISWLRVTDEDGKYIVNERFNSLFCQWFNSLCCLQRLISIIIILIVSIGVSIGVDYLWIIRGRKKKTKELYDALYKWKNDEKDNNKEDNNC